MSVMVEDRVAFSAREFAEHMGVSLATVRRRIADGSLAHYRFGRGVRIPRSELVRVQQEGLTLPPRD